jgi:uncharacterized metal-binding protein
MSCRTADSSKYPDFCPTADVDQDILAETLRIYTEDEELGRIARVAAEVEGLFYGRYCRVEETVEFIKRMDYRKIGIATCVGLIYETRILSKILKKHGIASTSIGCKTGAVDKTALGIPPEIKVNRGCGHESLCNPIMQAKFLEKKKTDFNIVMGLCVGHDSLFLRHSAAPTTVLVVKDRVLGHNPAIALYQSETMYSRFK